MKKNVVASALLAVALCMGLAACSSNAPAADKGSEAPATEAQADQAADGAVTDAAAGADADASKDAAPTAPAAAESANPPAANGFGGPIPEFDQGCLSCHESYEAVAEQTAHYGDSNPHNSVHGSYETCENCHAGDKVVNEDHKCLSCHDWPRQEDGHL